MRNTLDQSEGGLFGSESSDTYGGMFDMFMSQAMAEGGQLGIGKAVEQYLNNRLPESLANEETSQITTANAPLEATY